jgi:replicative DNA helicase Mcm
MSQTQAKSPEERAREFLETYCRDDIAALAQRYPKEQTWLTVDYNDLYQADADLAEWLHAIDEGDSCDPEEVLAVLADAVDEVDLPAPIDLSDVSIRVVNLDDAVTYAPGEIRSNEPGQYVSVRGTLERVTTTSDLPTELVYVCQRCGTQTRVPQDPTSGERAEPTECHACERKGPYRIDHDASEWVDYAKVRIQSRPDVDGNAEGKLTGYVTGDLIDEGGDVGLLGRVGEPVVVSGIIRRTQKSGRDANELLFDHLMDVRAIEFERDNNTVDVAKHKDAFTELAAQPEAIDNFAQSLAPQLHGTDAWQAAREFAVAYLFGAPRIDIPNGPTYRGDLHFLLITGYGMGKSTFKQDIAAFSPKCISKSTTALSSDVGLTAAAVKDDFGEGQWTIKPGLLVRANGGHLILDEIDKGPDELTAMNDAIEGEQVVDIEKAGQSATYQSQTAVMALGNPSDGRFNPNEPIATQLGIAESLLSRFDGIVTMIDEADREQDRNIAESWGRAYTESQAVEYGDRNEFDTLERPVPMDVGQAWIKYARENVHPSLTYEQFEELEEWYAEEVRQLNKSYAGDGEGSNMPVPATPRKLAAAAKMAIAFARATLRDEVNAEDIERAKALGKKLVKQNWDGEKFVVSDAVKASQQERRDKIVAELGDAKLTASQVADNVKWSHETVRSELEGDHRVAKLNNGRFERK